MPHVDTKTNYSAYMCAIGLCTETTIQTYQYSLTFSFWSRCKSGTLSPRRRCLYVSQMDHLALRNLYTSSPYVCVIAFATIISAAFDTYPFYTWPRGTSWVIDTLSTILNPSHSTPNKYACKFPSSWRWQAIKRHNTYYKFRHVTRHISNTEKVLICLNINICNIKFLKSNHNVVSNIF